MKRICHYLVITCIILSAPVLVVWYGTFPPSNPIGDAVFPLACGAMAGLWAAKYRRWALRDL